MKDIMKKIAAALLALALMAATFNACGKPDDEIIRPPNQRIKKPDPAVTLFPSEQDTQPTETRPPETETTTQAPFNLDDLIGPEDLPVPPAPPVVPSTPGSQESSSGGLNLDPAMLAETFGKFTNDMGFEYDTKQGIFYSSRDSWQRDANYFNHYDWAANYADMRYQTVYMEFSSPDDPYTPYTETYGDPIDWRIQFWKGQYGFLGGTELGIYTKRPDENEKVYACADDDHMMNIYYEIYKTKEDYENGRLYFYRDEWNGVGHWWVTGFKLDWVDPPRMVMKGKIHLKTTRLADALLNAMKVAGFNEVGSPAELTLDTCCRDSRDVHFVWQGVGECNYE